jgi:predicted  nucleic acid-binding Zn-ribbon protein
MSDLAHLVNLQTMDDDLDAIRAELAGIEAELADDSAVREAGERLAGAESRVADLARRQRASDAAIQDLDARIEREEKKLYDGSIKQFKELQALETDVEHLKAERRTLEDAALALLTELDQAIAERARLRSEHDALLREREARATTLLASAERLRARIAAEEATRAGEAAALSPGASRLYEGLRKRKGGKAVVRLVGSSCSGCRVAVPDAIRRQITGSTAIVQCPHCERILAMG